jgi:serine/threonine protein kinase
MDSTIQAGTVLGEKYRVKKVIGSGGMGIVVLATQIDLERDVAIKMLQREYRDKPEAVERFYREAKAAARIRGDHVAQIIDVSKTPDGDPYLVMEYLEGEDLAALLRREKILSVELAVTFMLHACSAVTDAHAARIIHRDLKPANLFLAKMPNGTPSLKVLDFGISRMQDQASQLTHASSSLGTAFYMAPEQIESPRTIDTRVDIWALGCIFHEFVTGATPFVGDTLPQIVAAVLRNDRRKLETLVKGIPPEVEAVIDKCLQTNPKDRYATPAELAVALAALTKIPEHEAIAQRLAAREPPAPPEVKIEPKPKTAVGGFLALPVEPPVSGSAPTSLAEGASSVLSLSAIGGVLDETGDAKKPEEKKPDEKKPDEKKPDDRKPLDDKPLDDKPLEPEKPEKKG